VKRTTEKSIDLAATIPTVRFTDYDPSAPQPSGELLGYYHSSALADWFSYFCIHPVVFALHKNSVPVRASGRLTVAQRFIAGMRGKENIVREADG
jgi:hypothetical protein